MFGISQKSILPEGLSNLKTNAAGNPVKRFGCGFMELDGGKWLHTNYKSEYEQEKS